MEILHLLSSDLMAENQNPSVHDPQFDEFMVLSLDNFVDSDRDELLLCTIRALCKYLSRTEQYCPGIEGLVISAGMRKKRVSRNTISLWLWSVISFAHSSALEEDCRSPRVRAREVRKFAMFLLFKRNCAVHQVLKAGAWSAQSTLSSFYLRDVTHRHLDTFSIGPVVAAQQVMYPASPFSTGVVTLCIGLSGRLYLCVSDPYILRIVMCLLLLLLLSLYSSDL